MFLTKYSRSYERILRRSNSLAHIGTHWHTCSLLSLIIYFNYPILHLFPFFFLRQPSGLGQWPKFWWWAVHSVFSGLNFGDERCAAMVLDRPTSRWEGKSVCDWRKKQKHSPQTDLGTPWIGSGRETMPFRIGESPNWFGDSSKSGTDIYMCSGTCKYGSK